MDPDEFDRLLDERIANDFKREAERILVGLGLPSTWDEFSAYNGNRTLPSRFRKIFSNPL